MDELPTESASSNYDPLSSLIWAVGRPIQLNRAVALLNSGADAFVSQSSEIAAVHKAARDGDIRFLAAVVSRSGPASVVCCLDSFGRGPLIHSILGRHLVIAEYLLRLGSDPSRADSYGSNAFYYAANALSLPLVQALASSCNGRHACPLLSPDPRGRTTDAIAWQTVRDTLGHGDMWVALAVWLRLRGHLAWKRLCRSFGDVYAAQRGLKSHWSHPIRLAAAMCCSAVLNAAEGGVLAAQCVLVPASGAEPCRFLLPCVWPVLSLAYSIILAIWLQPQMEHAAVETRIVSGSQAGSSWMLLSSFYVCIVCGWVGFVWTRFSESGRLVACPNPLQSALRASGIDIESPAVSVDSERPLVDVSAAHLREDYTRLLRTGNYDPYSYPDGAICVSCQIMRPPRVHHCRRCGTCVAGFDHCCPWIGGCITERNHLAFVIFLAGAAATCLLWTVLLVFYLSLAPVQVEITSYTRTHPLVLAALSCPSFLGIFAVALLYQHLRLIARGMTTNEAIHWEKYVYTTQSQIGSLPKFRNSFSKGSMAANCSHFVSTGCNSLRQSAAVIFKMFWLWSVKASQHRLRAINASSTTTKFL
jgi:hypothetical protein